MRAILAEIGDLAGMMPWRKVRSGGAIHVQSVKHYTGGPKEDPY